MNKAGIITSIIALLINAVSIFNNNMTYKVIYWLFSWTLIGLSVALLNEKEVGK